MGRALIIVLLLSICLFLQERHRPEPHEPDAAPPEQVNRGREKVAGPALVRQEFLTGLAAAPGQGFPANLPWAALRYVDIRREQAVEELISQKPTTFLHMCLDRYDREVEAYSCTLVKHERVAGKLKPVEVVQAHFREQPFSVFMHWKQGAGKAESVLFVQGENNDKMLARPAGLLLRHTGIWVRDVDSDDAKASGRYLINQFGIKLGTERTLKAMRGAAKRNVLHVRYEGIFRVPEAGDRLCYKLVRTPYDPPEDEGVNELTIYVDVENWLQVGSILKDASGKLIAEYFFRDLKINPTFKPTQFTRDAL